MRINNQAPVREPSNAQRANRRSKDAGATQDCLLGKLGKVVTLGLPLLAQAAGARPVPSAGIGNALALPEGPGALSHAGRTLQQANVINPQGLAYGGGLYIGGIGQASIMAYDSSLTYLDAVTNKLTSVGESPYMMAALQSSQLGIQSNLVNFEQRAPVRTPTITNGIISDSDVQAAIAQTLASALPASDPQLGQQMVLYVLPANLQAKSATRGTTSRGQCAYHDMASVTVGTQTARVPYAVIPTTDPEGHCFPQVSDPTAKMILEMTDQVTRLMLNPDHSNSDTAGYTVNGQDLVDACGLTPANIHDPATHNGTIQVPKMWSFGACIPTT